MERKIMLALCGPSKKKRKVSDKLGNKQQKWFQITIIQEL